MIPLFLGRRLETRHVNALGGHGADDMAAGAVLARAVDHLQHDQKRVAAVGVERALKFCDALKMVLKLCSRFDMTGMVAVKAGVDIVEINL